ncbi:Protein CBG09916, partial [Caenorhabditis briggsae]
TANASRGAKVVSFSKTGIPIVENKDSPTSTSFFGNGSESISPTRSLPFNITPGVLNFSFVESVSPSPFSTMTTSSS